MDVIKIKDLEIFSNHGVLKEENVLGQKFLISADIYLDTRKAGSTDDISDSVDYSQICHLIKKIMESNTFKLIETAAEKLSHDILSHYSRINRVVLEVKKPWAPILLPLEYVSVTVDRKWSKVYLSLGSNMGDREKYIKDAIEFIQKDENCRGVTSSSLIQTEPYGKTDQDKFLNCCVELETLYTPHQLHKLTSQAEENAGRERTVHWGPRTLDVDIILFDDIILHDETLTIPHIDMANREFVLAPLCELDPYAFDPATGKTAAAMLAELKR